MKRFSLFIFLVFFLLNAHSQDTITVQTLTFDSITTRRGTWQFPEGESFRKILMYHTLKCDPQTTHDQYDCGEWDYLTYNIIYQHTGVYDSTLYFHPNFTLIEGSSPDSMSLSFSPTYYYRDHRHQTITYPDTISLLEAEIGPAMYQAWDIIQNDHCAGRSQFLWKAEELASQGFTAGPVTSIKMHPTVNTGAIIHNLMIRMANVELEELTPDTLITNLDTVFYNTVDPGLFFQDFDFFKPFEWDGISDIVIDFSFTNPVPGLEAVFESNYPDVYFNCGITAATNGHAIDLDGISDFIKSPEGIYFNSDFTFETWVLKRSNNNWSRIFDFGNGPGEENVIVVLSRETSGNLSFHITKDGLSRSFELSDPTPLNEWTHVTLRLTGNIGWVYINGNLQKYGLLQTPPDMNRTINYIGRSNWNGDKMADVLLDEFRVYQTALPAAVIKEHFRKEINDPMSEPNLVLYYKFDEGEGVIAHDSSAGGHHSACYGYPNWYQVSGPELYYGFEQYNYRPYVTFERLESSGPVVTETIIRDSVMNSPTQIVMFENPNNPTIPSDTVTAWQGGYQPVYENWTVVDSVWAEPDTIFRKEMLPYYGEPFELIEEFEIGRYITPYGINLSLGPGFTWIYDVTDYAPLLQGMVDLSAGNLL
ncbi:MAG: LamG domain-containing protein [Bacteroidales bacterium]|nr:LamG domain-containing protein [Bacteroidales bacterium]